jgi:hypothetical protein
MQSLPKVVISIKRQPFGSPAEFICNQPFKYYLTALRRTLVRQQQMATLLAAMQLAVLFF